VFIFLLSIGLTYAYFSVTTNVIGDRNDIKAEVGTLSILYTDGPEIVAENIQPGWTTTKTIKVENTGTLKAFYSIDWASITNEIINDELVVSATCTSDTGTCDNITSTPITGEKIVVREGIDPGEEQTYVITFEFIEISSTQNYNQGKKFNGVLNVIDENESFTVTGTLLDADGNPVANATVEIHSEVRTGTTDANGNFEIEDVEVGNHEIIFKNSSNEVIATDTFKLISSNVAGIVGKEVTGNTDKGIVETVIKLNNSSSIGEIKLDSSLKSKILRDNILYADNVASTYVTSATGINFAAKSTPTNGQGLYTNNKLEDGSNTYFRGGSFCAYTNYLTESDGSACTAAGGTWSSNTCSFDLDRAACQSNGYTYYDLKNNVTFAGHKWKIIRIDENNNIRMILADASTGSSNYNNSTQDNAYVGYMYGTTGSTTYEATHANINSNTIKLYSDSWYNTNLSSYSSYIADAGYCNDRSISSGLGYAKNGTTYAVYTRNNSNASAIPQFACPNANNDLFTTASSSFGNKALTYPAGLLTADEARYGGLQQGKSYSSDWNYTNYLKMSSTYWIMSPVSASEYGPTLYTIKNFGTLYGGSVYEWVWNSYGFRPTIALKPTVTASGHGTYDDPYVIE
jgi:hypothetical protein